MGRLNYLADLFRRNKYLFIFLFISGVAFGQGYLKRLDVDNLRFDGNTISSTNTNGNIVISPNGTAQTDFENNILINHLNNVDALQIKDGANTGQSLIEYQNAVGSIRGRLNFYNSTQRFALQPNAAGDLFEFYPTYFLLNNNIPIRLEESGGSNYIQHKSAASITTDTTYSWPQDGSTGQALFTDGSGNLSWGAVTNSTSSASLDNVGFAVSVGSSAATIAVKQSDGSSDCSSGFPCRVSFDDFDGSYTTVSITGSISATIPSGATLGHLSGVAGRVLIYLINNAGTAELAFARQYVNTSNLVSTTALSTGSDSANVLYSTTARSNVSAVLIGKWISTQTTAGTWAASTGNKTNNPRTIQASRWEYGTWAPTLTLDTNLAAATLSSGVTYCTYSRLDNAVSAGCRLALDPTAGSGTQTIVTFTNPIANTGSNTLCAGTGASSGSTQTTTQAGQIISDDGDECSYQYHAQDTGNRNHGLIYQYELEWDR